MRSPRKSPTKSPTTKNLKVSSVITHEKMIGGQQKYIPPALNKPKVYDSAPDNAEALRGYVS